MKLKGFLSAMVNGGGRHWSRTKLRLSRLTWAASSLCPARDGLEPVAAEPVAGVGAGGVAGGAGGASGRAGGVAGGRAGGGGVAGGRAGAGGVAGGVLLVLVVLLVVVLLVL